MDFFTKQGWEFRAPLNYPVIDILAPEGFTEIKSSEISNIMPSNFMKFWQGRKHTVDMSTHQALLAESLQEYSDIWRTLAER